MLKKNASVSIFRICDFPSNFVCRFSDQSVFFSYSGSIVNSALNRVIIFFSARAKLFGLSQPPPFCLKNIIILNLSTGSSPNKMPVQSCFENLKDNFLKKSHFLFCLVFNFELWWDCLLCILRILIYHFIFSHHMTSKTHASLLLARFREAKWVPREVLGSL